MNWTRLGIAATAIAYMQWGPLVAQLGRSPTPPHAMTWKMYATAATDVCEVRLHTRDRRGNRAALDRFALLDRHHWHRAPRWLKRPENRDDIESMAKKLCRSLPREQTLHVTSRCATREGWVPVHDGEALCRGSQRGTEAEP